MKITLNGDSHVLEVGTSIESLISKFSLDPRKLAIEHNLCIIPVDEYSKTYLQEGDCVELVQFIGGG